MTDFEKSLMAIGGAIVVGVFLYNKWQEHKAKKSVERAFSSTHEDVLMDAGNATTTTTAGGRHEPTMSDAAMDAGEFPADRERSALRDDAGGQPAPEHDSSSAPSKDLPVDEMIDCLVPIAMAERLRGDKIIPVLQSLRHVGNKSVHFVGQREDQVWEPIAHGGIYIALFAGAQLANRSGALNELEYSELVSCLRRLCDELDADPDIPDMTEVMKSARALHQIVSQFDAKLSLNIQSNGAPWAIGTLLAALERQGFDLRPDGKLVMPDGDGGVLFSLSTNVTLAADTSARLTLLLDVPCVAPQRDGYGAMISFAKGLAQRLDGVVVDDGNVPLSDAALGEIAGQVGGFCAEMEAAGVPAGSVRALRLFA